MDNDTMHPASLDQAARALMYQLASAIAADLDTALRHGYGDLLLEVTDYVTNPGPRRSFSCGHVKTSGRRTSNR